MPQSMKVFYDSPRGKRERLRNRRTTIFRKAYELESKCNAQILVLIATPAKKYLYKSGDVAKVLEGTSLENFINESWPPPLVTSASDFSGDRAMSEDAESNDSPYLIDDPTVSEEEALGSFSSAIPAQEPAIATPLWNIKCVPAPPDIVISPTMSRPSDSRE